jgi:putative ABC transport system permease protein
MIRLDHVNKYFNRRKQNEIHVINDTTLELPESGIVTFLGPSGCGKTTLLNAIGGLDRINSGKIYIDDECITGRGAGRVDTIRNAKIGYIFQNFNLLDDRTVFENVALALRMTGIRDAETIRNRVNYCLEAVGIYQFRNKTADALSGGQRQRVAIARAIVKNPRIIIADEPTGNLDSANTLEVMNIIKTISKDRLVILVTHERKIAEFYSSRIIELRDGQVVSDRENDADKYLDYQLENRIYLKDMPVSEGEELGGVDVRVYGDMEHEGEIKLVIRGGNLYIDTGGRYNVVGEDSGIELVDDHYRAIDKSIYEKNTFEYDKYLPEGYRAKYRSLYTPGQMMKNGMRTLRGFRFLKKLLLVGFVFASMFVFLGISNVLGALDIKTSDFLTTNDHYVTVQNTSGSTSLYNKVASADGAEYALPGSTLAALDMPLDDYYQSSSFSGTINASVTSADTLSKSDIIMGRMPRGKHEIVLDKMTVDKFLKAKTASSVGIRHEKQFIGRSVTVPVLGDFKIVGISDTDSPSVYVDKDECMRMVIYANKGSSGTDSASQDTYSVDEGTDVTSGDSQTFIEYGLRPSSFKLKSGKAPSGTYDAVVSSYHIGEYKIGDTINKKLNGHKLKVTGFYETDTYGEDNIYVTSKALKLDKIHGSQTISIYSNDPDRLSDELASENISSKVNYTRDRDKYMAKQRSSLRSSMTAAAIIIAIALIEMFLMLRSSFLSRVKEVGTLRAIGVKKRDIYSMFTGEIILITLFTSIPGIALMYYILKNVAKTSTYFESILMVTPSVAVLSFVVVLVFNILVGLIPAFRTMRQTPAAILSRNDI